MTYAIRVENLGKQYYIGSRQRANLTFREVLSDTFQSPFRKLGQLVHGNAAAVGNLDQSFWALTNVSFEVPLGETLGIIGHNGAGKSTLLKVLSRITEPTEGRARVVGRVGSLLEVGTGFHAELTGRENIYLNGAILGMSRVDIGRRFDEIVDFAGVEKFIDTPVKHYSSGMYLRLAFAVAAHLETDILMVDEVLAVGDAQFQSKCLGKMGEAATSGRTLLFVSHNMAAIRQLCNQGIVLSNGQIAYQGDINAVIEHYLGLYHTSGNAFANLQQSTRRTGIGGAKILAMGCQDKTGNPGSVIGIDTPFVLWLDVAFEKNVKSLVAGIEVYTQEGTPLLNLRNDGQGISLNDFHAGQTVHIEIHIPGMPFYPGIYHIKPWVGELDGKRLDYVQEVFEITLSSLGVLASEKYIQSGRGVILVDCDWQVREVEERQPV
ncbi:MAG: ABC transporter ATP-binding protein [Anaerolineae bacterium]|nr:ABC transporter ATP-binding protein [Anaerolineae bacterium]